jgi:nitroreductase
LSCLTGQIANTVFLQLPKYVKPVGIICLGYPAETPEKLSRIDVSKLVHYENW